ncbi:MAG TPA: hypothetical protein DDW76_33360 [Cyanobacteria bacterium UBA11369]|nr:hypothetical protein [Cyanobacteria bacterium UBA11371]HBE32965.1 hypothetical protein [Cyanobacteria bacterium UBA11368]HBE53510.1 hypothetical protein [Cyanobacteria bacterium UBA11369]
MVYFIITWTCLTIVLFLVGINLLRICKADCFDRRGDRALAAIWLGIVAVSLLWLTLSLVLPLSPLIGWGVAIDLAILSLVSKQTRSEIVAYKSIISPSFILGFFTLELLVAILTTQQIVWFDTGLYHLGSIQWLSKFGAVYGVALINPKFGFTSSWFAFSAPLIPEFIGNRVGAIANGFVFLIALIHWIITLTRILKNQARLPDWFYLVYAGILILVYFVTTFTGAPILISFSADVAVNFLIGIIAWTILSIFPKNSVSIAFISPRIIPLIIACGTVAIKLSALPLLPGTLLFYAGVKPVKFKRLFWGIAVIILLLLPVTLVGIKTAACPLYPSKFMCLDLPWSVPAEITQEEAGEIKFLGELAQEKSPIPQFILPYWNLLDDNEFKLIILLLALSLIFSGLIRKNSSGEQWLILIGLCGMAFIITQSPLLRFGIGYFILIPCLFIAGVGQVLLAKIQPIINQKLSRVQLSRYEKIVPLVALSIAVAIAVQNDVKSRWLLPAELPSVQVIKAKVNDVEYAYPANWTVRCWKYPLPCAHVPVHNVKLRDPERGIGAGFVNTN